jgi:peroxiredoxin Q/BCP
VWGEKSYLGRTYFGIARSTFVIGEDGNVKKVMRKVKPAAHADEVLATLRS